MMKALSILMITLLSLSTVSCDSLQGLSKLGLFDNVWNLASLGDFELKDVTKLPFMNFDKDEMKVTGFDGCNNFNGSFEMKNGLDIGPLASTKMACPGKDDLASAFTAALTNANDLSINDAGELIIKKGEDVLASFVKQ